MGANRRRALGEEKGPDGLFVWNGGGERNDGDSGEEEKAGGLRVKGR